jgi:hypothetical protein
VEREREAYTGRIDRMFGIGTGWQPVLRFLPHPELVGRRVAGLSVRAGPGSEASIDEQGRLGDVDPRAPVVLASLVRGAVSGGRPGEALAVAIDGRIAAVGRSFRAAGQNRFSMLVPPHFFRPGANRAHIYRVLGEGAAARLQSLGP